MKSRRQFNKKSLIRFFQHHELTIENWEELYKHFSQRHNPKKLLRVSFHFALTSGWQELGLHLWKNHNFGLTTKFYNGQDLVEYCLGNRDPENLWFYWRAIDDKQKEKMSTHWALEGAIMNKDVEFMRELAKYGALENKPIIGKRTILQKALMSNDLDVINTAIDLYPEDLSFSVPAWILLHSGRLQRTDIYDHDIQIMKPFEKIDLLISRGLDLSQANCSKQVFEPLLRCLPQSSADMVISSCLHLLNRGAPYDRPYLMSIAHYYGLNPLMEKVLDLWEDLREAEDKWADLDDLRRQVSLHLNGCQESKALFTNIIDQLDQDYAADDYDVSLDRVAVQRRLCLA